ncbi:hypothetical protein CICLE_v10029711mg [Citrus x clementina]|uniref:Knottins-like domain-containing protein n=2 Tax=Citrus TaxID=2706 RepID=A0A067DKA4_CITSI|nr:defensin D2 [Citrus x clementina]ESR36566.1 hypothetical protein CICLE_v10029711mg [Citrus x clementina]KDO41990.1 hypothetical protein CISIN_1g034823mg [Citrus sinensis]
MAKSVASITTAVALIFAFFILFASFEMPVAEAKQCSKRAQKWTGPCIKTGSCRNHCRKREGAVDGACHYDFPGFACFCYYNC